MVFIEYSKDMEDIYKNIEDYLSFIKILIVFDDMIAHTLHNKKISPMITELFIRGRKLHISFAFIISYFAVSKNIRYFYTLCFCETSKQAKV